MFSHPLTEAELLKFLPSRANLHDIRQALKELIATREVTEHHGLFQLADQEDLSALRVSKERRAQNLIRQSTAYVNVMKRFPFVRGIAISGSLSKLSAPEDADIDYFIITKTNRLWIARTLLHIFKKFTFITGHQHCYCMNYFVAEDHLKLPFENFYTALELHTLIPVYGDQAFDQLAMKNSWTKEFLPNHNGKPLIEVTVDEGRMPLKKALEFVFNLAAPKQLNILLMRLTDWKWKRKFAKLNLSAEDYDRALMTRPYLSKNHPHDFQKKILDALKDNPKKPKFKEAIA